ncbi:MAG TPA: energy transducer TonB [candidate division Zixibacteria bacterium]|nr:energy transducer TonB [candidate division Zixibacteria bacterium]
MRRLSVVVGMALVLALVAPTQASEFDILMQSKAESGPGEKVPVVLIGGGYADGLKVGDEGSIAKIKERWNHGEKIADTTVLARLQVQDVSLYEAACLVVPVEGKKFGKVKKGFTAVFDLPVLSAEDFVRDGRAAMEKGDCEKAMFFFDTALCVTNDPTQAKALTDKIRGCVVDLRDKAVADTVEGVDPVHRDAFLALARFYERKGDIARVHEYFNRVFGPVYEDARLNRLLEAVQDGSSDTDMPCVDPVYPAMVSNNPPDYPREAKIRGITGAVAVKALVGKAGEVLVAKVGASSGSILLDNAAVEAAYGCRFKPGLCEGQPMACWVTYSVEFSLSSR